MVLGCTCEWGASGELGVRPVVTLLACSLAKDRTRERAEQDINLDLGESPLLSMYTVVSVDKSFVLNSCSECNHLVARAARISKSALPSLSRPTPRLRSTRSTTVLFNKIERWLGFLLDARIVERFGQHVVVLLVIFFDDEVIKDFKMLIEL